MADKLVDCHDCAAKPGTVHDDGCDTEHCSVCGGQRLQCDRTKCKDHDPGFARWTGLWPGRAEATALGLDLNAFYFQGLFKFFFVKPKGRTIALDAAIAEAVKPWKDAHDFPMQYFAALAKDHIADGHEVEDGDAANCRTCKYLTRVNALTKPHPASQEKA